MDKYVVRAEFEHNLKWKYITNTRWLTGDEELVESFFMSKQVATTLFLDNINKHRETGELLKIALVLCNSTYRPFNEREVVEYFEFK